MENALSVISSGARNLSWRSVKEIIGGLRRGEWQISMT
jgi:hypothetical protein